MQTTNKFLIVVDVQNDFVTGSLGSEAAQQVVNNIVKRTEMAKNLNETVIFTRDTHYNNYFDTLEGKKLPVQHCIKDTSGWCIIPELSPAIQMHPHVINKKTFGISDWFEIIKEYSPCDLDFDAKRDREFTIIGLDTDICVVSNALILRACFPDARITVIEDCCAGSSPENNEAALMVMESCQIDVVNLETELLSYE